MSALWSRFTSKLKESGYTLNDLVYCNEDLFLTIAEDMSEFTPLQIASLAKEWQRWMHSMAPARSPAKRRSLTPGTSPPPAVSREHNASDGVAARVKDRGSTPLGEVSLSASRLSPNKSALSVALRENTFSPPRRSPAKIKEEADYLLMKLGAQTGEEYQVSSTEGLVAVEASPEAWSPFIDRLARMHPTRPPVPSGRQQETPTPELQLLWKLCSPATLDKMEKACVSGAPFGLSNHNDTDGLCSSAVVFYQRDATRLSATAHELGDLFRAGWALVAFDVAVGKARIVTKDEAQTLNANLYRFSMEQCLEMLGDAGFDAFHIPSRNAVAVCHMHQAMPRFVVYVTPMETVVVSRRLGDKTLHHNSSDGSGGAKAGGAALAPPAPNMSSSSTTTAVPTRAPPVPTVPPVAASAPSAGGAPPATSLVRRVADDLCCSVHPLKTVEFWSPTEKRLLCSHCLYYDGYSQENCIPIEQAAREEVPRLERWVQNATTFTHEIKGVYDLVDAAQADVSQAQERVRGDIKQSFTRLRSRLDALETNLLQQCQQRTQQSHGALQDTLSRITATLQFVQDIVKESDYPIAAFHSGSVDIATCVSLLRSTQRAFGAWEPVLIPSYENVSVVDGGAVLQPVEEALKAVQAVTSEPGKLQLPEAIDVNYLKADCDI
ncbi:hypothetical protein ABL78_0690 [Leptomonas seymouri]|uniref:Uncharacterized protein n=1 Tax=Leptomonas seymouri TaxID=5684 RepID=A0A0N1IBM3_LEPSE|nr:hypothetical protein ABL78_0690 [Leptomonas seymouri]|eukprot:KPI90172.1 hypothetical protein ABL78_0690 [Leptomonas seymouri]